MFRRILESPWLYFSLAGVLLVVGVITQFELKVPSRRVGTVDDIAKLRENDDLNVVFILIDTLRADRLSAYGYARETTPVLDYLARTGVRFRRAIAQSSWTKASMASMWTSLYPGTSGVLRWNQAIPEQALLPAEIFREAGFFTAGVFRNGWVAPNFGFQQGFESYFTPRPGRDPERFQRRTPSAHPLQGTDADLTDTAVEFLKQHHQQRFFLYVHYMDVHQYAYDEASAKFGTSFSDVYDNAISWTDRNVGVLVQALEDLGVLNETVIVIASDHGEGFREHGLEGHGKTLYREVTEVPLILAFPFRLEPGIVVAPMVQNVDIWPTVLDLLGLPPLPGAQGRSLVSLIEAAGRDPGSNGAQDSERPAFAHLDRSWGKRGMSDPIIQVTSGSYRLIKPLKDGSSARLELFDHASDPLEQRNVAQSAEDAVSQLNELVEEYLAAPQPAWGEPDEVELDEMRLGQLRALGYVIK